MVSPYDKSSNLDEKRDIARVAVQYVEDGMVVGVGSGSTMELFVKLLVERLVQQPMNCKFVASSKKIEQLLQYYELPLLPIEDVEQIDIAFDGADRVDKDGHLIKGGGGSLFRERLVLLQAAKKYILVDGSKHVDNFAHAVVPIEVIPIAQAYVEKILCQKNIDYTCRQNGGKRFLTDNYNSILDVILPNQFTTKQFYEFMSQIHGVVDVGIFLNDGYIF